MPENDIRAFIHALPKVELHLHLVGSASVDTVLELARRHPEAGVPTNHEELAAFYRFRDFDHFIKVYFAVQSLLKDRHDIRTLVVGLATELQRQHVRYAEVTVTPYNHVTDGMALDEVLAGIEEGRKIARDNGVELAWCFDIPGEKGIKAAEETLAYAVGHRPDGLVSFGLGGPEVGIPRAQFAPFFDAAREAGLHCVPHAGETSGPETVWSAIRDLKAERIGHGTSSTQDPELVAYLAEHRIPLEVCPTSNVCTRQVESIATHPVRHMLDQGVVVTLNTDDPPMFGATLEGEYLALHHALDLGRTDLAQLARNGIDASFLDSAGKAALNAEIDALS